MELYTSVLKVYPEHFCLTGQRNLISLEDIADSDPNTILRMDILREYSSSINKRMTTGPMGKGWIVPNL